MSIPFNAALLSGHLLSLHSDKIRSKGFLCVNEVRPNCIVAVHSFHEGRDGQSWKEETFLVDRKIDDDVILIPVVWIQFNGQTRGEVGVLPGFEETYRKTRKGWVRILDDHHDHWVISPHHELRFGDVASRTHVSHGQFIEKEGRECQDQAMEKESPDWALTPLVYTLAKS